VRCAAGIAPDGGGSDAGSDAGSSGDGSGDGSDSAGDADGCAGGRAHSGGPAAPHEAAAAAAGGGGGAGGWFGSAECLGELFGGGLFHSCERTATSGRTAAGDQPMPDQPGERAARPAAPRRFFTPDLSAGAPRRAPSAPRPAP